MYTLFLFYLLHIVIVYADDKQLVKSDIYSKQINHYYPHKPYKPNKNHQFKLVCECFYK